MFGGDEPAGQATARQRQDADGAVHPADLADRQPQPANFARVQVSSSGVLVDFGFLEPAGLDMLARTARAGGKMPEAVQGRLAGRFALTPEALLALHEQLGRVAATLRAPRKKKADAN